MIPVLIGGAQMPRPEELPGPISALSHLNAFEIYDRMLDESFSQLEAALSPSLKRDRVPGRWSLYFRQHWKRSLTIACSGAILIAVGALVLTFAERSVGERPDGSAATIPHPVGVAPTASDPGINADTVVTASVALMHPSRITQLPPIVEAARHGLGGNDFRKAVGPRHPNVLWKATFPSGPDGLAEFIGVAGDGTLFFLGLGALGAIREGKEQWMYRISETSDHAAIKEDGRVCIPRINLEHPNFFCFNSRGEGGLIEGTLDDLKLTKRRVADTESWWDEPGHGFKEVCDLRTISGTNPNGFQTAPLPWTLKLDSECENGNWTLNDHGDMILITKAGTMYCVAPQGRIRWSRKVSCQSNFAFALGGDDLVYGCGGTLHDVRAGEPRWELALGQVQKFG